MIPQISQAPGVVQLVLNFLQALEQQGFTGDTATSYADRLTMSTDNSIYQLLPDAVVFTRSTADVALIARLAAEPLFSSLIFTPRGGGTGTNGQALNQGIIVDMSRYMSRGEVCIFRGGFPCAQGSELCLSSLWCNSGSFSHSVRREPDRIAADNELCVC